MGRGKNEVILTFAGDAKQLEKTLDKVGSGAKQVGGDFDDAGKKTDTWKEKFGKFNKVAVGASLAVGAGVIAIGKDAYGLSQELTNLDKRAETVFGDQLPKINEWAEANKHAFGGSASEIKGSAAALQDLLVPLGFARDEAAEMTTQMMELAPAFAAWEGRGRDAAEVAQDFEGALLGNREGLKKYGISISEAEVQAKALEMGLESATGEVDQQAKALATQELIMEKSADAQAAWADGGREAAEQQNASKVATQELRESLARGLTPAFEAGTAIVAKFAGWAERNQGVVKILAGVIVGLAAVVLTVNAAIKIAAAVQALWNLAMAMNPIGLVVLAVAALVAGIVWLATKTQFFQTIWEGLKIAFGAVVKAIGSAFSWVRDLVVKGFNQWRDRAGKVVDWLRGIPGRLRSAFGGLFRILTTPFRTAFNFVADAWNNTVGQLSWSVPDIPGLPGRGTTISAPRLPKFHDGIDRVPGAPGSEMLAVLEAGEKVTPASKNRGGEATVIEVRSGGAKLDDLLVEILARAIRVRGGNAQLVLGGRRG